MSFRAWYDSNKDAYNKKRRDKYRNDASYRATVRARNDAYKKRTQQQVQEALQDIPQTSKYVQKKDASGQKGVFFTIGAVSLVSGVSRAKLLRWEAEGRITAVTRRSTKDARLYSKEELTAVLAELALLGEVRAEKVTSGFLRSYTTKEGMQTEWLLGLPAFAQELRVSLARARQLLRQGLFPVTPLQRNGRSYYTQTQLQLAISVRDAMLSVSDVEAWREFRTLVESLWEPLGLLQLVELTATAST